MLLGMKKGIKINKVRCIRQSCIYCLIKCLLFKCPELKLRYSYGCGICFITLRSMYNLILNLTACYCMVNSHISITSQHLKRLSRMRDIGRQIEVDKTGTKSFTAKHLSWDLRTRDDLGNRCPVSP